MEEAKSYHATSSNDAIDAHFVAVWNLRVWIIQENDFFFAQGLEVDYAAQGRTRDEAMSLFREGFVRTIDAHLHESGTIDGFLKPVSAQVLMAFNAQKGDSKPINCLSVSLHLHNKATIETIEFYELPRAA